MSVKVQYIDPMPIDENIFNGQTSVWNSYCIMCERGLFNEFHFLLNKLDYMSGKLVVAPWEKSNNVAESLWKIKLGKTVSSEIFWKPSTKLHSNCLLRCHWYISFKYSDRQLMHVYGNIYENLKNVSTFFSIYQSQHIWGNSKFHQQNLYRINRCC